MESSIFSQQESKNQNKKSASDVIKLDLTSASLKNTLQLLTERLSKNLILDHEVEERNLNMSLKNITALEAFKAILEANNLAYKQLEGNVYFVANAEKIEKQTVVKNYYCKYADATKLEAILKNMVGSESGAILADKRTNTLIIKESPDILMKIEKLISELDKPTKQIYIQAEILELSSKNETELGVDWLSKNVNYKAIQGNIGTEFDLRSGSIIDEAGQENSENIPFPVGNGLGIGILHTDINAALHALSQVNNINLLSRPRIVTLDNQKAVIEVGDQIPFKVLNEFGVTSFEFKDATVQLIVKPHIIDSEYITMEVSPKADFQNGFTPDGTPIISTRKATTNVKVRNGQTIVIGGLIRDSILKSESKVPILGSIPILGLLFKSTKTTNQKTELIVFITPVILEDGVNLKYFENDFEMKHKFNEKLK